MFLRSAWCIARASLVLLAITACGGGGDKTTAPDPNIVASVVLDQSTVTLASLGLTQQVNATARNAAGTAVSGKTFTWTTSAASVATVSASGLVTSVGSGSATITATLVGGTASAQMQITVVQIATTMTITPTTATIVINATQQFAATAADANGAAIASPTLVWVSSAPTVATVSQSGVVTALSVGTTTVLVTAGTVSRSATVTVVRPDLILTRDTALTGTLNYRSITVPTGVTLTASGPLTLRATGPITVAGAVVGSCVSVDMGSDTAFTISGRVNNGCTAGTGGDLRIAATGELRVLGGQIASSGDITLTNNPALSETSFLVAPLGLRKFSFAQQPGGIPLVRFDNAATVVYFGGATGPSPAANGTSGANPTNGTSGHSVKMFLDGTAIFAGGTTLWGQDGGNGGNGVNTSSSNLTVTAGNGGDGGLIKVYITGQLSYIGAGNVVRSGKPGNGGSSNATATTNSSGTTAPSATAIGGVGGAPGLIDMRAGSGIIIDPGALTLQVPSGGTGGAATATAANGVDATATAAAQAGGSASATGGKGGSTPNARLSASATVGAPLTDIGGGGDGGAGIAIAGVGGNGLKPNKNGANGGNIAVTGGGGGAAQLRNLANALVGNGGNGGNGTWRLGNGGIGWSDCVTGALEGGGNGGIGGSATGARGNGGSGVANGNNGTTTFQNVGNGGNGGSGAGPGSGGNAGTNSVPGPIGAQTPPIFTTGTVGFNCTPPPPPPPSSVSIVVESVLSSSGIVNSGIQNINITVNNIVRGLLPLQFVSPTFFGLSPNRFGVGPGGSVTFKVSQMLVDGLSYNPDRLQLCAYNSFSVGPAAPVNVQQFALGVQLVTTNTITTANGCVDTTIDPRTIDIKVFSIVTFDFYQIVLLKSGG